jgi:hypothetical protein
MRLPAREDFNTYGSLDEVTACRHFCNKTLTEAEALFRENSLTYCQDFMWMGAKAFNFYLDALIKYVQSDESAGDNDIVNCIPSVIEYRLMDAGFAEAIPRIRALMEYVIGSYGKFDIDSAIYGDLLPKYMALQQVLDAKFG